MDDGHDWRWELFLHWYLSNLNIFGSKNIFPKNNIPLNPLTHGRYRCTLWFTKKKYRQPIPEIFSQLFVADAPIQTTLQVSPSKVRIEKIRSIIHSKIYGLRSRMFWKVGCGLGVLVVGSGLWFLSSQSVVHCLKDSWSLAARPHVVSWYDCRAGKLA